MYHPQKIGTRLLSMLFSILIVCSTMPTTVFASEPEVSQPVVSEPVANAPATGGPSTDKPAANGPDVSSTDEPAASGPDVPSTDEPAANGPDVPSTDEPAANGPDVPSTDEPAANGPDVPSTDEPAANGPDVPSTDEPAANETDVAIADGSTVYISDSGNDADGDGTAENPFATLQYAIGKLSNRGIVKLLSPYSGTLSGVVAHDVTISLDLNGYNWQAPDIDADAFVIEAGATLNLVNSGESAGTISVNNSDAAEPAYAIHNSGALNIGVDGVSPVKLAVTGGNGILNTNASLSVANGSVTALTKGSAAITLDTAGVVVLGSSNSAQSCSIGSSTANGTAIVICEGTTGNIVVNANATIATEDATGPLIQNNSNNDEDFSITIDEGATLNPEGKNTPASPVPTTDTGKDSAVLGTNGATFTLSNTPESGLTSFSDGIFLVYSDAQGTAAAENVTATFATDEETGLGELTLAGAGLAAGTYYVSAYSRAHGKGYSAVLPLTVTSVSQTLYYQNGESGWGLYLSEDASATAQPTELALAAGKDTTWSVNENGTVLTLTDFNFSTDASVALRIPAWVGQEVQLTLSGKNSLTTNTNSTAQNITALVSDNTAMLTINGEGSLTVLAENGANAATVQAVKAKALTVAGGTVIAKAGTTSAATGSIGLITETSYAQTGGEVQATGFESGVTLVGNSAAATLFYTAGLSCDSEPTEAGIFDILTSRVTIGGIEAKAVYVTANSSLFLMRSGSDVTLYFDGTDQKLYAATPDLTVPENEYSIPTKWNKGAEVTGLSGYSIDTTTKTLTLDGFNFDTSANAVLVMAPDTKLHLADGSVNTLTGSGSGKTPVMQSNNTVALTFGLVVPGGCYNAVPGSNGALFSSVATNQGNLTISGGGSLEVVAGDVNLMDSPADGKQYYGHSMGICAGNLSMDLTANGKLVAKGGSIQYTVDGNYTELKNAYSTGIVTAGYSQANGEIEFWAADQDPLVSSYKISSIGAQFEESTIAAGTLKSYGRSQTFSDGAPDAASGTVKALGVKGSLTYGDTDTATMIKIENRHYMQIGSDSALSAFCYFKPKLEFEQGIGSGTLTKNENGLDTSVAYKFAVDEYKTDPAIENISATWYKKVMTGDQASVTKLPNIPAGLTLAITKDPNAEHGYIATVTADNDTITELTGGDAYLFSLTALDSDGADGDTTDSSTHPQKVEIYVTGEDRSIVMNRDGLFYSKQYIDSAAAPFSGKGTKWTIDADTGNITILDDITFKTGGIKGMVVEGGSGSLTIAAGKKLTVNPSNSSKNETRTIMEIDSGNFTINGPGTLDLTHSSIPANVGNFAALTASNLTLDQNLVLTVTAKAGKEKSAAMLLEGNLIVQGGADVTATGSYVYDASQGDYYAFAIGFSSGRHTLTVKGPGTKLTANNQSSKTPSIKANNQQDDIAEYSAIASTGGSFPEIVVLEEATLIANSIANGKIANAINSGSVVVNGGGRVEATVQGNAPSSPWATSSFSAVRGSVVVYYGTLIAKSKSGAVYNNSVYNAGSLLGTSSVDTEPTDTDVVHFNLDKSTYYTGETGGVLVQNLQAEGGPLFIIKHAENKNQFVFTDDVSPQIFNISANNWDATPAPLEVKLNKSDGSTVTQATPDSLTQDPGNAKTYTGSVTFDLKGLTMGDYTLSISKTVDNKTYKGSLPIKIVGENQMLVFKANGKLYIGTDDTTTTLYPADSSWSVTSADQLNLNNFTFSTSAPIALLVQGNKKIQVTGNNEITSTYVQDNSVLNVPAAFAVKATGNLSIAGTKREDDKLTLVTDSAVGSSAIETSGTLNVEACSLTANNTGTESADGNLYGILAGGSLAVKNASVTAVTAGSTTAGTSASPHVNFTVCSSNDKITVESSTLTATNGQLEGVQNFSSAGIYAKNNLSFAVSNAVIHMSADGANAIESKTGKISADSGVLTGSDHNTDFVTNSFSRLLQPSKDTAFTLSYKSTLELDDDTDSYSYSANTNEVAFSVSGKNWLAKPAVTVSIIGSDGLEKLSGTAQLTVDTTDSYKYAGSATIDLAKLAVGSYTVKAVTNKNAVNEVSDSFTITITKASYTDQTASQLLSSNYITASTLELPELPDDTLTYPATGALAGDAGVITAHSVSGRILSYTTGDVNIGKSATLTFKVSGSNCDEFDVVVTFTVVDGPTLTISGVTVADKTYDGIAVAYTGSPTAKLDGNTVDLDASQYVYTWEKDGTALKEAPKDAGTYKLVVSITKDNKKYKGKMDHTFTINKKVVTAIIPMVEVYQYHDLPTFTIKYEGFVGADDASVFETNSLAVVPPTSKTQLPGKFALTATGEVTARNYTVTTKNGELSVFEKKLSPPAGETIAPVEGVPTVGIPTGSLPSDVQDVSNLLLSVYTAKSDDSDKLDAATKGIRGFNNKLNLEISLIDTTRNNLVVQPNGEITVCIPYPDGTNSKDTFTILHLSPKNGVEMIKPTLISQGLQFNVLDLSPFAIGWTKNTSSGGSGGSGSGGFKRLISLAVKLLPPKQTVINAVTGKTGTSSIVNAVKTALQEDKSSTSIIYRNFESLLPAGVQTIGAEVAKALDKTKTNFNLNVYFDTVANRMVAVRISANLYDLQRFVAKPAMLGVITDQKDKTVLSIKGMHKDAKTVVLSFTQREVLNMNVNLATKVDLSGLNTKTLYFYSYNPLTQKTTLLTSPGYFTDTKGYIHITTPFGGDVIITDSPLVTK